MFTTRAAKEIGFINRFYTECSFFASEIQLNSEINFNCCSLSIQQNVVHTNFQFTIHIAIANTSSMIKTWENKPKIIKKKSMRRDYHAKYYPLGIVVKNGKSFHFDENLVHFHCFESACISFYFLPFALVFRFNRKSLERSVDLTTHLYFISTFPIAIKIKTLCAKHRVECKQTANHSHQFMRCKQTIRSNNAPTKYTCTDNSTINWKTYLPYDYMQPNSITKTSRKRKTPN